MIGRKQILGRVRKMDQHNTENHMDKNKMIWTRIELCWPSNTKQFVTSLHKNGRKQHEK